MAGSFLPAPPYSPPSSGGGGTFDGVHNDLDGRTTAGAHPSTAISYPGGDLLGTTVKAALDSLAAGQLLRASVILKADSLTPDVDSTIYRLERKPGVDADAAGIAGYEIKDTITYTGTWVDNNDTTYVLLYLEGENQAFPPRLAKVVTGGFEEVPVSGLQVISLGCGGATDGGIGTLWYGWNVGDGAGNAPDPAQPAIWIQPIGMLAADVFTAAGQSVEEALAAAGGGGTSHEFIFNPSGAQSGDRYNDWSDLVARLNATDGETSVQIEENATVPDGSWNMDYVELKGNNSDPWIAGATLTVPAGANFSSWKKPQVGAALCLLNQGTPLIEYAESVAMVVSDGGVLASEDSEMFLLSGAGGSTFSITLQNEGRLFNGLEPVLSQPPIYPNIGNFPLVNDLRTGSPGSDVVAFILSGNRTLISENPLVMGGPSIYFVGSYDSATLVARLTPDVTGYDASYTGGQAFVTNYSLDGGDSDDLFFSADSSGMASSKVGPAIRELKTLVDGVAPAYVPGTPAISVGGAAGTAATAEFVGNPSDAAMLVKLTSTADASGYLDNLFAVNFGNPYPNGAVAVCTQSAEPGSSGGVATPYPARILTVAADGTFLYMQNSLGEQIGADVTYWNIIVVPLAAA